MRRRGNQLHDANRRGRECVTLRLPAAHVGTTREQPPEAEAAQSQQDLGHDEGAADSDEDDAVAAAAAAADAGGSSWSGEERGGERDWEAMVHGAQGQAGAAAAGARRTASPAAGGGAGSPSSPSSAAAGADDRRPCGSSSSSSSASALSVLSTGLSRARRHIRKARGRGDEAGKGALSDRRAAASHRGDDEEESGGGSDGDGEASDDVERDDVSLLK
eukprot:Tamp_20082.p1 GENE.Tamp_20082~~Tamp_20082.p1  ORF type:complete len:218 (+),score=53.62 Tamp_20082:472-1125(+)